MSVEPFQRNQWKKWIDWGTRISGSERQLRRDDLTNFTDFNARPLCDLSVIYNRDLCHVCFGYVSGNDYGDDEVDDGKDDGVQSVLVRRGIYSLMLQILLVSVLVYTC